MYQGQSAVDPPHPPIRTLESDVCYQDDSARQPEWMNVATVVEGRSRRAGFLETRPVVARQVWRLSAGPRPGQVGPPVISSRSTRHAEERRCWVALKANPPLPPTAAAAAAAAAQGRCQRPAREEGSRVAEGV